MRRPVGRRVAVIYPRGARTGGPEALHQLVDALRGHGVEAGLVPHPRTAGRPRVEAYSTYDAPEWPSVREGQDVVIGPEVYISDLLKIRRSRVICWWLSIDNSPLFRAECRLADWRRGVADSPVRADVKSAIDWARRGPRWRSRLSAIEHLAQSTYAHDYLAARLSIASDPLSDYIAGAADLLQRPRNGRTGPPLIAYNPAKGARLVSRLRETLEPPITWVPIAGMSREEVLETLRRVDVYLDMGAHPGKDRIPREAVLMGAVTVVARRGSAAFHDDVPIPFEHTISITDDPIIEARRVLASVLSDRPLAFTQQADYRKHVVQQEQVFRDEAEQLARRLELDAQSPERWS